MGAPWRCFSVNYGPWVLRKYSFHIGLGACCMLFTWNEKNILRAWACLTFNRTLFSLAGWLVIQTKETTDKTRTRIVVHGAAILILQLKTSAQHFIVPLVTWLLVECIKWPVNPRKYGLVVDREWKRSGARFFPGSNDYWGIFPHQWISLII